MAQLGLPVASGWDDVQAQLSQFNLSYLPLRHFCQPLHELMQLRPLLGLRSPVNTLARMLNPLRAPCTLQSIFHPAYAALHQDADQLLGQPRAMVFKGDSGEVEIKPQADTRVQLLAQASRSEVTLPRVMSGKAAPVDVPRCQPLRALWCGQAEDHYGEAAVTGTATVALMLLRPEVKLEDARAEADRLWLQRDRSRLD